MIHADVSDDEESAALELGLFAGHEDCGIGDKLRGGCDEKPIGNTKESPPGFHEIGRVSRRCMCPGRETHTRPTCKALQSRVRVEARKAEQRTKRVITKKTYALEEAASGEPKRTYISERGCRVWTS